jgi:hypothetical protein
LKRKLHLSEDEVWSWQVEKRFTGTSATLGVRIRSPEGKTWWADADQFVPNWNGREEDHWDCYCCSECFRYSGWGFAPSFIRRYVDVVCKRGKSWDYAVQARAHNGWGC